MKKVICVAAKIKKSLRGLVESKLAGHEIVWLEDMPREDRLEAIKRSDIMQAAMLTAELSPEEMGLLGGLEMVQTLSAGVDQADFSLLPGDIKLFCNPGGWARGIAEHALAMALCCTRMLRPQTEALGRGVFDTLGYPTRLLSQCRVLIVGWGGIGRRAGALFSALGSRVEAVGRTAPAHDVLSRGWAMADIDEALPGADIALLSLPLTGATRGLFGEKRLALMKENAVLINVARAELIDRDALECRLRAHPSFFAGIDVWWKERGAYPAGGDPLLALPNVVGSAHNSFYSSLAKAEAAESALDNIVSFIEGRPVKGRVDLGEYRRTRAGERA